MIGRLHAVSLDCPDPEVLLTFYQRLTGWPRAQSADGSWYELDGGGVRLSFHRVLDHHPPRWPDPAFPQQLHLDFMVDDLDTAEPLVLALGALLLQGSPKPIGFRVYADPAGHPFCLTTN